MYVCMYIQFLFVSIYSERLSKESLLVLCIELPSYKTHSDSHFRHPLIFLLITFIVLVTNNVIDKRQLFVLYHHYVPYFQKSFLFLDFTLDAISYRWSPLLPGHHVYCHTVVLLWHNVVFVSCLCR